MKRIGCIVIAICLLFSFTACNFKDKLPDMSIQKSHLTEEEKDIIGLLGTDDQHAIYDFKVSDSIKTIQINTYKLNNGKWSMIASGARVFEDASGRIALSIDDIAKGCRVAIQSENDRGSNSYTTEVSKEQGNMGRATSYLTDTEEIVYEQEIPLVIQIQTSKNIVGAYDVEYFYEPEKYSQYGYEHVYAITVMFSKKTLDELDTITKNKD